MADDDAPPLEDIFSVLAVESYTEVGTDDEVMDALGFSPERVAAVHAWVAERGFEEVSSVPAVANALYLAELLGEAPQPLNLGRVSGEVALSMCEAMSEEEVTEAARLLGRSGAYPAFLGTRGFVLTALGAGKPTGAGAPAELSDAELAELFTGLSVLRFDADLQAPPQAAAAKARRFVAANFEAVLAEAWHVDDSAPGVVSHAAAVTAAWERKGHSLVLNELGEATGLSAAEVETAVLLLERTQIASVVRDPFEPEAGDDGPEP